MGSRTGRSAPGRPRQKGTYVKSRFLDPATLVFAAIIVILILWIGSGMVGREPAPEGAAERPVPVVAASWSEATPVARELILYGEVAPNQVVAVRARTAGLIEEVVARGTPVAEGDLLASLSTDDRDAQLARSEAQVAAAEQSAAAARQLAERGIGSPLEAQAREAELVATRAALRAIELDIENTRLRAPVSGTVNQVIADVGAYVAPGGEVVEIVNNDPLLAIVRVPQSEITAVRPDMPARVRFIGGEEVQGRVSFVSPLADAATRTFRVEIEIPNPESRIPAGISAEVVLVTETVEAHHVSSALVRLDETGTLGVYTIDDESRIRFSPITLVTADSRGLWISGIGASAHLVTITQGAIAGGQQVEVRETPAEYLPPAAEGDAAAQDAAEQL